MDYDEKSVKRRAGMSCTQSALVIGRMPSALSFQQMKKQPMAWMAMYRPLAMRVFTPGREKGAKAGRGGRVGRFGWARWAREGGMGGVGGVRGA